MRTVRKQQIIYASVTLGGVIVLGFELQKRGVPWWWLVLWIAIGGVVVLLVLRALEKAERCPKCELALNAIQENLEKQGASLKYCPSCGRALGANQSLQADPP